MNTTFKTSLILTAAASFAVCTFAQASEPSRESVVRKSQKLTDTGFTYMLSKDYAGAKPYFERALEIEPNLAMAHLDLGAVYQNTGNPTAAAEQFRLAIANDTSANDYPRVRETTDGSRGTVTDIANRNMSNLK